jgi:hypothetical protein
MARREPGADPMGSLGVLERHRPLSNAAKPTPAMAS